MIAFHFLCRQCSSLSFTLMTTYRRLLFPFSLTIFHLLNHPSSSHYLFLVYHLFRLESFLFPFSVQFPPAVLPSVSSPINPSLLENHLSSSSFLSSFLLLFFFLLCTLASSSPFLPCPLRPSDPRPHLHQQKWCQLM